MRKILYLFGQLNDDDVRWMAAIGKNKTLVDGQAMIEANTKLDAVFVLLRGELAVRIGDRELTRLEPGEIVGEMSLVDARPTSATVVASGSANILEINKEKLVVRLNADTGFAARFYRGVAVALSDRLRNLQAQIDDGGETIPENPELVETTERAKRRFRRLVETAR